MGKYNTKISVITPTIRPEGLKLVKQALSYQDFRDWEWIICSPKTMEDEVRNVVGSFDFKFIGNPPLKSWQVWDLNYSYNRLIEKSEGELVVSWQDYTFADPDVLFVLWKHYLEDKKAVVSVLGNKYPDDDFDIPAWIDPRYEYEKPTWEDIEWNFCSCPKDLLYKIGGFCEEMDRMFGLDGFSVNQRLYKAGIARFKLEKQSKTYSLFHGRVEDWDKKNYLGNHGKEYNRLINKLKSDGSWPYLDKQYRKLR